MWAPRAAWSVGGYYPGIALPYTRPWYRPGPVYPHPYMAVTAVPDNPNTQFQTPVGEPRGVEHRGIFRVPDWFIDLMTVYTAV